MVFIRIVTVGFLYRSDKGCPPLLPDIFGQVLTGFFYILSGNSLLISRPSTTGVRGNFPLKISIQITILPNSKIPQWRKKYSKQGPCFRRRNECGR